MIEPLPLVLCREALYVIARVQKTGLRTCFIGCTLALCSLLLVAAEARAVPPPAKATAIGSIQGTLARVSRTAPPRAITVRNTVRQLLATTSSRGPKLPQATVLARRNSTLGVGPALPLFGSPWGQFGIPGVPSPGVATGAGVLSIGIGAGQGATIDMASGRPATAFFKGAISNVLTNAGIGTVLASPY